MPRKKLIIGLFGILGLVGLFFLVASAKFRYNVPMHLGRSHHMSLEIAVSVIGGFAASFLTFTVAPYMSGARHGAQLIAGDPSVNRELPTTLNMMQRALDGQNPVLSSLGNYGWWVAVVLGGIIASFIIFRMTRRYI